MPDAAPLVRALTRLVDDALAQDWPTHALYLVATPIGNRADITVRALACLAIVDAIAAEDTRTARPLLAHYGIDKPLIAAHRHNENEAAASVVARLADGARIAFVSDAGTPAISDPGATLARAAHAAGRRVVPIPGASALAAAVSAAGLPEGPIAFEGFLPAKAAQRARRIAAFADATSHLVVYEAPHRIVETLAALRDGLGAERTAVVARELTKRFESIERGPLGALAEATRAEADRQRGEFVVIVEGVEDDGTRALGRARPVLERLMASLPVSEAASLAAELTGVSRKALYVEALKRTERSRDGPDGSSV